MYLCVCVRVSEETNGGSAPEVFEQTREHGQPRAAVSPLPAGRRAGVVSPPQSLELQVQGGQLSEIVKHCFLAAVCPY